jgi:NAD(P)-dependent dehydrogenase (short-subunit alcohol dehydrogenase family)
MSASLQNKVWLITGATGIAAATAQMAVHAGADVFVVSNVEADCGVLVDQLRATGGRAAYHVADLTVPDAVGAAVQSCLKYYPRIDALFNVVGISGRRFGDGPIHECTPEGWDVTMTTNVKTMFLMCREVVRQMLQQPLSAQGQRGAILNMASVLAVAPEPQHFATHAYAASKGAIISLTQAMAAYYAPHKIRVNAVAPALTRTPMSARAQADQALLDFIKLKQPLSEDLIEAEDVARAALFLLSDEARYITGEILTVDAGWRVSG